MGNPNRPNAKKEHNSKLSRTDSDIEDEEDSMFKVGVAASVVQRMKVLQSDHASKPPPSKKKRKMSSELKSIDRFHLPIPQSFESSDDEEALTPSSSKNQNPKKRRRVLPLLPSRNKPSLVNTASSTKKAPTIPLTTSIKKRKGGSRSLPTSKNRPTAVARKIINDFAPCTDSSSSSDEEPEETIITSSANLLYSWDALKLGEKTGSAALNSFLQTNHPHKAPKLTPRQVLQKLDSMRLKTIVPPVGSALHQVTDGDELNSSTPANPKPDFHASGMLTQPAQLMKMSNFDGLLSQPTGEEDDVSAFRRELLAARSDKKTSVLTVLSKVYDELCQQDVDEGMLTRRQVNYLTPKALVEKFREIENRVAAMKVRQDRIVRRSKQLGVYHPQQIYHIRGYRDPIHVYAPLTNNRMTENGGGEEHPAGAI